METENKIHKAEKTLVSQIIFRFFPYWPLFLALCLIGILGAYIYLRYATPLYDISATVLIKDEKKGSSDSRIMQSLNIMSSDDIVENEIEILHSKALMNDVVLKLYLYAPIYSEGRLTSVTAYASSPVKIEVRNPQDLDTSSSESKKIYFDYDFKNATVKIENKNSKINEWVSTSYGTLKFMPNPNYREAEKRPLYFYLMPPKAVTNSLIERLGITQPNRLSSIVKLNFQDDSPRRGEDILNELINTYNIASIEDKNQFSSKTLSIVTDKLANIQQQVDSIQHLINQYKQKNEIVNLSEQSSLFLQNVGDNDQKLADINRQLSVLNDVEKYVSSKDQSDGTIPSTLGINDPVLSNFIQKLYDLELNYQRLKMTATENNPAMQSLANDIAKTKSAILENAAVQRVSLNASRNNLNAILNNYSSKLNNIPDKERDLITISRQLSALNNAYDFFLQKKQEASLTNASTLANSRTIDNAQSSITPTSPQKIIVVLIALAAALAIGIVVVLCREMFSSTIMFRADINKYTNIPVMAEILDTNSSYKHISENQKNIIVNEQFRQLATSIKLYTRNSSRKKLLITSSITGEGKTFVSTNLASCFATSGKKVIILDFDFRNPRISETYNLSIEHGISDFLNGQKNVYEIIKRSEIENLFVAGAGTVPLHKANELLLSEKLGELFNYLEEAFDLIIVDTAPVEPVTDAYILSEYCDFSLYVVKHAYTPKSIIGLLDENNRVRSLKNIAIVFNGVKPRGFAKNAYGYGYGFTYDYAYNQRKLSKHH